MAERIILAYSGGLDTSCAIRWLKERYDYNVIALSIDLGQPGDLDAVRRKALQIGAVEAITVDLRTVFVEEFISYALKGNALYEGKYPLATALARPLIARTMVEAAHEHDAVAVAHGCTGKGNDQVRFDVTTMVLDPSLKIVAPLREWNMSREDEIEYARKKDIPIPVTIENPFSIDENIWGRSCESGVLEDPYVEPPEEAYEWTLPVEKTPDEAVYLTVVFKEGLPISLNGEELTFFEIISRLNEMAGAHGIGRIDHVENRLVGIKSREIYEAPAATVLIEAHRALELLVLTRDTLHFKPIIEMKLAEMIYNGQWYEPLRKSISVMLDDMSKHVNGEVRLKLYKGHATVVGRKSDDSLYSYSLATYDKKDKFSHESSRGFIDIWGLPLKVWGSVHE